MNKLLITILILLFSTACGLPNPPFGADLPVLSISEQIRINGIDEVLKDKTPKEKSQIKSKELAAVELGKFIKNDIEIEIVGDIKEIDGGIELFAKAFKNGKQLGFGKDGTVEIERFRFFNPPVLVDDPDGDITREWVDEKTGEFKQRKLKYNTVEAIMQMLEQTVSQVGKDGSKIIKDKIGNTTDTFYSTTADGVIYTNAATWAGARDATSGTAVYNTQESVGFYVYRTGGGNRYVFRAFISFLTEAIPDTNVVSSANIGLASSAANNDTPNDGYDYLNVFAITPADPANLVVDDFDQIGSTAFATAIDYDNWASVSGNYTTWTLNSSGINAIDKTTGGLTKLGFRFGHDIENVDLANETYQLYSFWLAEYTGTTRDPKLVVEHSAPVVQSSQDQDVLIFD